MNKRFFQCSIVVLLLNLETAYPFSPFSFKSPKERKKRIELDICLRMSISKRKQLERLHALSQNQNRTDEESEELNALVAMTKPYRVKRFLILTRDVPKTDGELNELTELHATFSDEEMNSLLDFNIACLELVDCNRSSSSRALTFLKSMKEYFEIKKECGDS